MDASASMENSKRQRMFEGQSNDKNVDIISHLPENILHYILSFLPTKYAVGTSVLSTRWKLLWTSIHNLDFCDELLYSRSTNCLKRRRIFIDFVDRVLFFQDVSNIYKFSLTCKDCDATHFNKWISTVIKRKVQELILSITRKPPYMFPHCLLTCESLRVLKIEMDVYLDIPASICFSCLKVLHLEYITFSSDLAIQEVSISCPILEEFKIVCCKWSKIKTVDISVPTLRMLTIEDYQDGLLDCVIQINAESLISLKLSSGLSYEYSLCNLSSLTEAFLDISYHHETVHRVDSLLRGISNVRDLELSYLSIETLSRPAVSAHMHSLSRLINLRVGRVICLSGRAFIDLLCNLPNLKSLFLPNGIGSIVFKGYGRILGTTPQCFLSHLKLVDINNFRGIQNELWFVKFLMKSVKVMDKLTIKLKIYPTESPVGWKQWITEQLGTLPKGSKCVLEVS